MLSAAVALVLALRLPLEVAVFAVLVFGLPHVVLELRYVNGRFLAPAKVWIAIQVVVAAAVLNRFAWTGRGPRIVETVLLGGLLLLALLPSRSERGSAAGSRTRVTVIRALALAATAAALALAILGIDSWFLVQAHLHNILPLLFLWEWTGSEVEPLARRRWRVALVGTFVAVPAVILSGVLDPLAASAGGVLAGTGDADKVVRVSNTLVPAGTAGPWAGRLVVAFAFAQLVHYAVWCWFLPRSRAGEAATARLAAAGPIGRLVRGWPFALLLCGAALLVLGLAWVDLARGRSTYTSLAASHALLEYPLLVLLARGAATGRGGHAGTGAANLS